MRIYEQTKFATVGGDYTLWWLLQPLVMSKAAWDKLTPAQKKIFEEAANKSDEFFAAGQREAVKRMEEAYVKAGAKVARSPRPSSTPGSTSPRRPPGPSSRPNRPTRSSFWTSSAR